jgi:uncharacterized protein YjbI with pentapeptide repeats
MTRAGARTPDQAFAEALDCARGGASFLLKNMRITEQALEQLLVTARLGDRPRAFNRPRFTGVTFPDRVRLDGVAFEGGAVFVACVFESAAVFSRATFGGDAEFAGSKFKGAAELDECSFTRADFRDTTWSQGGSFVGATFEGAARFDGRTSFGGDARFDLAIFGGDVRTPADCGGEVWFDRATFDSARTLGPLKARGRVVLDGAVFSERVTVTLRAPHLSASGTQFRSGADILVQSAVVALDAAEFGADSALRPATRDTMYGRLLGDDYEKQTLPRVVSVMGARVANLAMSGVDLRACRFRGAHGLDGLRLEQVVFAEPPLGWQRIGHRPTRWTRRLAVAEEHRWRAERQGASGWWTEELRTRPATPNWQDPDVPTPHQVAAVYRALRKAQESRNDAPGAADFYYGEMEMRRQTRHDPGKPPAVLPIEARSRQDSTRRAPAGETAVLSLYWLVSGYGLRASRALAALAVTVAVGALLLYWFGFQADRSYGRSLLFAFESSVSLLRAPTERLTDRGELVTIALRLLGPLFFGLALLALRGRVKR